MKKRLLSTLLSIVMILSMLTVVTSAAHTPATLEAYLEDYRVGEEYDDVEIEFRNDDLFDEEESYLLDESGNTLRFGRVERFTKYTLRVVLIPERNVDLSALTAKNITLEGTPAKSLKPFGKRGIELHFDLPVLTDHHLPFWDISQKDWYFAAVEYVYNKSLMHGTETHAFSPDTPTTREQLITVLWRMQGSPRTNAKLVFKDVKKDGYSATAIRWGYQKGIVKGISDTAFAPKQPLTREQLVSFFYRYAEHLGRNTDSKDTLKGFRDAGTVSRYARPAMRWAVQNDIVEGVGRNTLAPRDTATRAQIASILMRF